MTTKLMVVNHMLRCVGEPPVGDLETTEGIPSVDYAILVFDQSNLEVQASGLTENMYIKTFSPNVDNHIILPENILSLSRLRNSKNSQLVERNGKLYSVPDESYEFTEDIEMEIVVELPFEDLPFYVQNYIQALATTRYLMSHLTAPDVVSFAERQYQEARLVFNKNRTKSMRRGLDQNLSVQRIINRRLKPRGVYDYRSTSYWTV